MKVLMMGGVALLCASLAQAAGEAGMVKTAQGQAVIERGGQKLPAAVGTQVLVSDRITTGKDGSVGITLRDNTLLSAGPNAVLELNKFAFDSTTHAGTVDATLKRGTLSVVSGKIAKASPDAVAFRTPTMTLGVRGTEFAFEAEQGGE